MQNRLVSSSIPSFKRHPLMTWMGLGVSALVLASTLTVTQVKAQDMSNGANNFYQSDSVTQTTVTFNSLYKTTITGNLYIPKDHDGESRLPAIVVSHPMGAVKEQSANLYATKLAEMGFITLSIDLPFWGASEGEPRNAVSPDFYAEAFSAGVDFLGSHATVDAERIGGLGICGSGSFVLSAAKIDPRIKAIATVSMYNMGAANRHGLKQSLDLQQRQAITKQAAAQRYVEFNGGEVKYTSGSPHQIDENSSAIEKEFYDFYRTSRGEFTPAGSTPQLTTHPTLTSNVKFMNFYPFADLDMIAPRPLLFISGDQAHSIEFSQDAYAKAVEPKELYLVPAAGHVDLYDRVDLIPWQKLHNFYGENL